MQPKLIGPADGMIYTAYHPAKTDKGQSSRRAVLICPPFGQEAIRSHRCLKLLGDRLARSGIHVLRMAYRGTDDSAWWSDEVNCLRDWIQDIQLAKRELQAISGCATVGLIGLRLGANLAVEVAHESEDVHSVTLWEPIVDGHRFLSELRKMQAEMVDLWHCRIGPRDTVETEETEELLSTCYQRCLLDEIERLQLDTAKLKQPTLVIHAADPTVAVPSTIEGPSDPKISRQAMEKQFLSIDPYDWNDLAELEVVWWRPQTVQQIVNQIDQVFQRLDQTGWFRQWDPIQESCRSEESLAYSKPLLFSSNNTTGAAVMEAVHHHRGSNLDDRNFVKQIGQSASAVASVAARSRVSEPITDGGVETVHSFGFSGALVGVLNRPPTDRALVEAPVVLMLNAGIVHRVGPFRLHVDIARTLSQHGFTSFRFDLSGIGDSQPRKGKLDKDRRVESDVAEAIDYLKSKELGQNFIILGLCSGAYHGHHVALNNRQIVGGIFMDGIVFPTVGFYFRHYVIRCFDWRFWRNAVKRRRRRHRYLKGQDYQQMGKRLAEAEYFKIDSSRQKIAAEIKTLKDRSLEMLFVFTGAYENYRGRKQFQEMWGIKPDDQVQVEYMPESEHTFRMVAHRQKLCNRIAQWMRSRTN